LTDAFPPSVDLRKWSLNP
jgi:hypothetical protein